MTRAGVCLLQLRLSSQHPGIRCRNITKTCSQDCLQHFKDQQYCCWRSWTGKHWNPNNTLIHLWSNCGASWLNSEVLRELLKVVYVQLTKHAHNSTHTQKYTSTNISTFAHQNIFQQNYGLARPTWQILELSKDLNLVFFLKHCSQNCYKFILYSLLKCLKSTNL